MPARAAATETIQLDNRPPGTRVEFEAREIIDAGFLELVRYGVRRADDPLIVDSLKVVDAVLKRDLPQGPGWLRYNWDGYGQRPDGGPFQGWGQGRVWPLLTGERAHYELAAGNDIDRADRDLRTVCHCRADDAGAGVGRGRPAGAQPAAGQPAGSAVPLVWAHAEYLKLLRSAVDGKVFDRIDPVYERYCDAGGQKAYAHAIWRSTAGTGPSRELTAGETLRILDEASFEVVWIGGRLEDEAHDRSRELGSAGFSADISTAPNQASSGLLWTLHWPEQDAGLDTT